MFNEERKIENEKKRNKKTAKGENMVGSKLMIEMNKTKCFIEEMKNLTFNECGIISRLRSEHIDLNLYNNVIYSNGNQTDPNCENCNFYETVRHYLIDCERWDVQRADMFYKLSEIDEKFKLEKNRNNIMRLLFPHLYQKRPHKPEKIQQRVKIIRLVCKFVSETKRFVNETIKSKIFENINKEYNEDNSIKMNKYELTENESASMKKINDFLGEIDFYMNNFDSKLDDLIDTIEKLHE